MNSEIDNFKVVLLKISQEFYVCVSRLLSFKKYKILKHESIWN